MLDAVVRSAMPLSATPRQRLLEAYGGCWEGLFHRLGPDGREIERFPTRLRVSDEDGTIEAAHTYLNTGRTVPMRFSEPPAAMQISAAGHWSLGMDRMGPWPWIAELCVVHGERRRRVVLRHGLEKLESFTDAREWRPGTGDGAPDSPLVAVIESIGSESIAWGKAGGRRWHLDDDVEVVLAPAPGQPGPVWVTLSWQPAGGAPCRIERRYSPYGLLELLTVD